MKMVIVIYRRSLDNNLRHFLKSIDVKSFAESPTVSGIDAGHAFGTWPGHHAMILSAMEDHQAERVIARLKDFGDQCAQLQGGAKIPMRVFAIPCERVI
jgi:hypothetical protein